MIETVNALSPYIVFYREDGDARTSLPLVMRFEAETPGHAKEQLLDAEPGAKDIWVFSGGDLDTARTAWRNSGKLKIETTVELPAWFAQDFGEQTAQDVALAMILCKAHPDCGSVGAAWSISQRESPCFVGRASNRLDYFGVPMLGIVNGPPGIVVHPALEMPQENVLACIEGLDNVSDFFLEEVVRQSRIGTTHVTPRMSG